MARVVHLTTIVIVVLASAVSKRRTFLHYSNYLKKSQPHHWKYDQEELGRRVEQIARGHQVRAQLQPLHPHDAVPWHQWTRAARLAALNDVRNREINQVRTQLLQQKLSLKPPARQPLVLPQVKPKIRVVAKNPRHKGDLQEPNRRIRTKREIQINPQLLPEVVKQSHNQPAMTRHTKIQNVRSSLGLHFYNPSIYYPEVIEALTNRTDPYQEQVKRNSGKRQILYWVKPVQQLRAVATTPDPNNFETEKQEPGEQKSPDLHSSYQLSEIQNVIYEYTKSLLNLKSWLKTSNQSLELGDFERNKTREKRSPKMSKLHKKQKLAKKKRKKKKQQKLTPRQIKHYRRIREHKEERRKILHKKLKEKRRLRHKKMGTGPYNKTIIDYYGVYFDPPSSQLNDSLYDSVYDSSAVDSDKVYEEGMKNYPESEVEGEEYEDEEEETEEGSRDREGRPDKSNHKEDKPETEKSSGSKKTGQVDEKD